jgi:hypothetical protein
MTVALTGRAGKEFFPEMEFYNDSNHLHLTAVHRYSATSAVCVCGITEGGSLLVLLWDDETSSRQQAFRAIRDDGVEIRLTDKQLNSLVQTVEAAPLGPASIDFSGKGMALAYPILNWARGEIEFLFWLRNTYEFGEILPTALFGGRIAAVAFAVLFGRQQIPEFGCPVYFGICDIDNCDDVIFCFLQLMRIEQQARCIIICRYGSADRMSQMWQLLCKCCSKTTVYSTEGYGCIVLFDIMATQNVSRRWVTFNRKRAMGDVLWVEPLSDLFIGERDMILQINSEYPALFRYHPRFNLATSLPAGILAVADLDEYIDLDWAYEREKDIHLLEAYGKRIDYFPDRDPVLYLSREKTEFLTGPERIRWETAAHRIAVHLAMTSPDRIWPLPYWRRLIDSLLDAFPEGIIVVVGSRDDASARDLDLTETGSRIIDLTRRLDVLSLGRILADCDVLLAVDSGVAHIGIAVGTKVVCLYSMALPQWRSSKNGKTIPVLSPVDCVGCLAELREKDAPLCKFGRSFCYDMILPETVMSAVETCLSPPFVIDRTESSV